MKRDKCFDVLNREHSIKLRFSLKLNTRYSTFIVGFNTELINSLNAADFIGHWIIYLRNSSRTLQKLPGEVLAFMGREGSLEEPHLLYGKCARTMDRWIFISYKSSSIVHQSAACVVEDLANRAQRHKANASARRIEPSSPQMLGRRKHRKHFISRCGLGKQSILHFHYYHHRACHPTPFPGISRRDISAPGL